MPNSLQETILAAFQRASGGQLGERFGSSGGGLAETLSQVTQAASAPTGGSQQTLQAVFSQANGGQAGGQSATTDGALIDALGQAAQVIGAQTAATSANTEALVQSQSKGSSAAGAVSGAVNTASEFLGGGLSLMPLFSLFSGLFSGGQSQPAPLVPFSLPPSLSLETTTNNQNVTWGESGLPRATPGGGSSGTTQITVQVQAMDSQSFLDHSDDIAQAVRQAMLNMNPINDAITSL
ncbi:MAG TPA: hypothetical protein VMU80_00050 [Bryobacteraceae bacterium]|nr:hypothetical protein [Bryobacteraceae bacterium]